MPAFIVIWIGQIVALFDTALFLLQLGSDYISQPDWQPHYAEDATLDAPNPRRHEPTDKQASPSRIERQPKRPSK